MSRRSVSCAQRRQRGRALLAAACAGRVGGWGSCSPGAGRRPAGGSVTHARCAQVPMSHLLCVPDLHPPVVPLLLLQPRKDLRQGLACEPEEGRLKQGRCTRSSSRVPA